MAIGQSNAVLRPMERRFGSGVVTGMSEGQLLERFITRRDEAAFEALVARHGPMVLGVCRQLLRDPNDVDDAFQATFLVLVKKANTLRDRHLLGNWLYGVAYRVAVRARAVSARRSARETADVAEVAVPPVPPEHEPNPWLHEEIRRLPEKYRVPVVLCYLEGLTHEEAADHLGWPVGTVKGRLARARDLLRTRLTRRGLVYSSGALAALLARDASAAVPPALFQTTLRATALLASGQSLAGLISVPVLALTEGAIQAMLLTKLKSVAVALLVAGAFTTGAGVLAFQEARKEAVAPAKGATLDVVKKVDAPAPQKTAGDRSEEALAREALKELYERLKTMPGSDIEPVFRWSIRLLSAELQGTTTPEKRIAAYEGHLGRMQEMDRLMTRMATAGQARHVDALEWQFRRVEAQKWLADAQAAPGPPPERPAGAPPLPGSPANEAPPPTVPEIPRASAGLPGGMAAGPPQNDMGGDMGGMGGMRVSPAMVKKLQENTRRLFIADLSAKLAEGPEGQGVPENQAIHKKLGERIAMAFPNETPLEDILKYIKSATSQGDKDPGIPIYVDPEGLKEAEKTPQSVVVLDLEGVPLKTTLRLALKQLGLAYCVKDGVLIISSVNGIYQELKESLGDPEEEQQMMRGTPGIH